MRKNKIRNEFPKWEYEDLFKYSKKVRSEFFFKFFLQIIVVSFIATVSIIHLSFVIRISSLPISQVDIIKKQYLTNPTINWIFFSSSFFLIIYFLKQAFFKVTPSIVKFVENEIKNLGLKLEKRYRTELVSLILIGISSLFILLIDFGVLKFKTIQSSVIFQMAFIGFLSFSILIPIGLALFQKKYSVKLKDDYSIFLKVDYPIIRRKSSPELLDIYFASSALSLKSNRWKFDVYKKICEKHWLIKSKIDSDKRRAINPFIFFKGYGSPLEFQDSFINVALAIKEWDEWDDCEKLIRERISQEMKIEREKLIYTICLEMRFNRN